MQTEEGQEMGQKVAQGMNLLDGFIPIPGAGLASQVISMVVVILGGRKFWDKMKASEPGSLFGKRNPTS